MKDEWAWFIFLNPDFISFWLEKENYSFFLSSSKKMLEAKEWKMYITTGIVTCCFNTVGHEEDLYLNWIRESNFIPSASCESSFNIEIHFSACCTIMSLRILCEFNVKILWRIMIESNRIFLMFFWFLRKLLNHD